MIARWAAPGALRQGADGTSQSDARGAEGVSAWRANRVRKYIGAYMASINGCNAICFAGGIGENAVDLRKAMCANLSCFGIELDEKLNKLATGGKEMMISSENSIIKVYVIPTNEELVMARDTARVLLNA